MGERGFLYDVPDDQGGPAMPTDRSDKEPRLGLASTDELLDELLARLGRPFHHEVSELPAVERAVAITTLRRQLRLTDDVLVRHQHTSVRLQRVDGCPYLAASASTERSTTDGPQLLERRTR